MTHIKFKAGQPGHYPGMTCRKSVFELPIWSSILILFSGCATYEYVAGEWIDGDQIRASFTEPSASPGPIVEGSKINIWLNEEIQLSWGSADYLDMVVTRIDEQRIEGKAVDYFDENLNIVGDESGEIVEVPLDDVESIRVLRTEESVDYSVAKEMFEPPPEGYLKAFLTNEAFIALVLVALTF